MKDYIDYLSKFVELKNFWTVLLALIPFASNFQTGFTEYLFPPIGWTQTLGQIGVVLLWLAASMIIFTKFADPRKGGASPGVGLMIWLIIAFIIYLILFQVFVYKVEVTFDEKAPKIFLVAPGYQRSESGNGRMCLDLSSPTKQSPCSGFSDADLMRKGVTEKTIETFWTKSSTITVRTLLYVVYLLILLPLFLLLNLFVLKDYLNSLAEKKNSATASADTETVG